MYNKKLLNKATKDLNKIKRPYTGMKKPRGLKIPKQQPSSSPTNFESESYKLEEGGTMNSKEHGIDMPFYIDVEEKKSPIHGTGLFTKQPLSKDQPIGISHIRKTWEKNGQMLTGPVPSKHIAGYNHSENPNVKEVDVGSHITLVAIKDIQPGEELVVDYTVNTSSDLEHPDDFKNKDLEKAKGGKGLGRFNFKNPFRIKTPKFPQVISPNAPFIKPGVGSIIKKGRSVSVEDANRIIQNIAKEFPDTNVENAPVFYHGTNSSALQGIQTVEGLTNLTNLAHLGITPMAGELSTGAIGVNKQGISTAFVDNLNSATRYSMANGLLKTPVEDFQEWWGKNRLEYFGASQYFPTTEYYDNLYNQRLENYESLVGDEKSFIDSKFPMLFGIHPKYGDYTRFKVPSSDIQSETVIKDLISFDEIPNLFVPKSKIDLVSDYLNAHKNNVHVSDIEPFINRKGVMPWVSQLYNKQNYKDGGTSDPTLPPEYLKSHGETDENGEYQMKGFEKAVNEDLDSLLRGSNTDGYDSHWYGGEAEGYGVTSDVLRGFASDNRPKSFVNAAAYAKAMNELSVNAGGKRNINIPFADNPIVMRTDADDLPVTKEYVTPETLQEQGYIDATGTNAVNQDQSYITGLAKRYGRNNYDNLLEEQDGGYVLEEMHNGGVGPGHPHPETYQERWNREWTQSRDQDNTRHVVNERPLLNLDGSDPDADYNQWIAQNIDYGTNPSKSWLTHAYEGITGIPELIAGPIEDAYDQFKKSSILPANIANAKKDTSKSIRERLYRSVTPIGYDWKHAVKEFMAGEHLDFTWDNQKTNFENFDKLDRWKDPETGEMGSYGKYVKDASMDAWGMYLGFPQKYDTYKTSEYKPSKSKNKNANYYSFNWDDDIWDEALEYKVHELETNESKSIKDSGSGGFTLQNYKLSKGYDKENKLPYISYYDENNYEIGPFKGEDIVGKPFEVYGRMYYDPKTMKRVFPKSKPKKREGGSIEIELDDKAIQKYVDGGYIVEEVKLPRAKGGLSMSKLPRSKGFTGIEIRNPESLRNLTTNQLENILKYADVSDAYQNNVVNSEQLKAIIRAGENAHAQLFDKRVISYLDQDSEDPMKFRVGSDLLDLDRIRALPNHIAYHALHGSKISNMLRNSVNDYVKDPYAMFDLNFRNDLEKMSESNSGTIRFPIKEFYHGFKSDGDFNFENLELDRSKIPAEKLKKWTTTGKSSKFANWQKETGKEIIGAKSKHQFGLFGSYNLQGLRDPAGQYSGNAGHNSLALRLRPEEALKDTRSLIKNIKLDDNVKLLDVNYKDKNKEDLKVKEIFRDILEIGKYDIGLPTFSAGISGDLNLTLKAAKRLKEKYGYDGLINPGFGELVITNKDVIKGIEDRDFKMFDYHNPLDFYMSSLLTSNQNLDKMLDQTGGLRNLTTINDYYHPQYSEFRLPKDGRPSRAWPQIETPSYWPTDDPSSKRLQDELLRNWFQVKFAWNRGAGDNVSSYIHDKDHPDFPIKNRDYTYPFDESWYEKLHPENLPFIKKEGGELLKANGGKIIKTVWEPPKNPIKTRIGRKLKNLKFPKDSYFSDINNAISFYKPRIDNIVSEQLKWIASPEYIRRREATTGESKEEIVNSVKKQSEILNLIDLNKSFNIKPLSKKVAGSAQVNNRSFLGNKIFGAKPKINLDQNMFFTDPLKTLGTAEHETIHLSDPFLYSGTEFPFETAYNNYPFLNIDKPNLTFGQKIMNKFIDPSLPNNLISNKDLKAELKWWEYNTDKMEQKVRFKRLNDVIRQDLGLGKMYGSQPQLTMDNINKWISDRGTPVELSNYLDNSGLDDVNALLKLHSKTKDYSRTNLLDQLNKAWGLAAPLGLGLGYTMDEDSDSSYKYGGSLPKAKWGISGTSWPPKFNLPFYSGLKYNKNGSISKIYNPYFKKWQEPRANVDAFNELLNVGHANRELVNEWKIRDINNIAKKSLQIIDPKKYDKESTLEYVKWHQEFAKLKESTIDKVADLKLEGNPLPPHEERDLYEKFNSWLSVNTPPLQLDHMRNTSYSGLRDLSDKSTELVNRQIDDLNPHFDNFNIRKEYDLGINNMFKKLSFLEKLKSFRPKHDFGSSMYDSIAEDYTNVRDAWERDYTSINKERDILEKLREYDLSTEPSQQKMINDYQELFHNIMTPLQHTDIDLPNDGDELIGFQNGGVVELGDEVDEPTMQRLKKQGYTFEKI